MVAFCVALVFLVAQVFLAEWSGSLAIMSDALHLCTDLIGYIVAIMAVCFSGKNANKNMSFGWHRAELLGTLITIFSIWIMSGMLIHEGIQRLHEKPKVIGWKMLIASTIGFTFNMI